MDKSMTESSISISSLEALVIPAESLEEAVRIRKELVLRSSGCWFFLYGDVYEIFASNESGGKLSEEKLTEIQALAKIISKEKLS